MAMFDGRSVQLREALPTVARNAWAVTFGDGVEPRSQTPSTVIYDEPHRTLRRYDRSTVASGNPILLVPPLAVRIECFDLRPRQSLVAHLIAKGRQAYVIDYGDITFADRAMGFEDWIDDILPTAIARVSAEHDGALVDLVAWSLGGTISFLTAAAHPDLPIGSITAFGTPFDYSKIPGIQLSRRVGRFTGGRVVTSATAAMGGVPSRLVRTAFKVTALQREITKPWFLARNIAATETLAQVGAIDRFIGTMPGYPGRFYIQTSQRLIQRLELAKGRVRLGTHRVIELKNVTIPVQLIGSTTDSIAPAASVAAGVRSLSGADVRYAEVVGSHLGIVAGPSASTTTWPAMDEFLSL